MGVKTTSLIAKLKRRYPELMDEPLLDDLELASGPDDQADEEDSPADDGSQDEPMSVEIELGDEDQTAEDEPADGEFSMPDLEKEADLMSDEEIEDNPGKPAKKKKRKPADDESGDEPTDVNGKY